MLIAYIYIYIYITGIDNNTYTVVLDNEINKCVTVKVVQCYNLLFKYH